ncbi:hypothetical protein JCM10450v2_002380 [Rhodotorula kratochvilovae]
MPPLRDPNRLFYDAANPVMLSQDEVLALSPAELQAATDQLDQNLVLLLQRVEENFARCNEIVTERILPAVEVHGENSQRIFQSVKFWRPFFEAAANIRLNEPYAEEGASVAADEPSQATISPDRTVSDEGDVTYGSGPSVGGTPRAPQPPLESQESSGLPEPQWSTDAVSPFHPGAPPAVGGLDSDYSAMKERLPDVQRLRTRDFPPDSPDVGMPQFETINVGNALGRGAAGADASRADASNVSRQSEQPSFLQMRGSPAPRHAARAGGDKAHSALLNRVLHKGLASPATASRPGQSTPGAAAGRIKFPHDLPSNWDGIANLSTTSLDAFPSPIKRRANASHAGDDSLFGPPPSTAASSRSALMSSPPAAPRDALNASTSTLRRYGASPAPPQSAAFTRTPAKEAARRTVQNVYDALGEIGSPTLELPSALRNPRTMAYDYYTSTAGRDGSGSPSERSTVRRGDRTLGGGGSDAGDASHASAFSQPSFVTRTIPYPLHPQESSRDASAASLSHHDVPLADFGGGTTANIDALLAGHDADSASSASAEQYAGIVDDDGGARFGAGDESYTGEADEQHAHHNRPAEPTYTEGFDEGYSRDEDDAFGARALRLPGQDGPEDTLFGMPAARTGGAAPSRRVTYAPAEEDLGEEDDSFAEEARRSGFRLHGMDEMATLHGGELLASEPFQASPLAGRYHQ